MVVENIIEQEEKMAKIIFSHCRRRRLLPRASARFRVPEPVPGGENGRPRTRGRGARRRGAGGGPGGSLPIAPRAAPRARGNAAQG